MLKLKDTLIVRDQSCVVLEILTDKTNTCIEVTVRYSKGGVSYWDYTRQRQGYSLSFNPITREGGMTSFLVGSGLSLFVEEATRFNRNALLKVAAKTLTYPHFSECLAQVAAKSNLTIDQRE